MEFGLLWFDASPKVPVAEKIAEAAERYEEKYGQTPNTCYVHPTTGEVAAPLRIVPSPVVRPHHFWLGIESDPSQPITATARPVAKPAASKRPRTAKAVIAVEPAVEQPERENPPPAAKPRAARPAPALLAEPVAAPSAKPGRRKTAAVPEQTALPGLEPVALVKRPARATPRSVETVGKATVEPAPRDARAGRQAAAESPATPAPVGRRSRAAKAVV